MERYSTITDGLPSGFEIRLERHSNFPRSFSLLKDDVVVAAGREFDTDHRRDRGDWFLTYYAAPETKTILDTIMSDFREYQKRALEQRRRELEQSVSASRAKAHLDALDVLKDYIKR